MEQKRKKRKRKKIIITLLVILALAGCGIYYYYNQTVEADAGETEIVADENQTLVYAEIDSINGNEMTYTIVEPEESETAQETSENQSQNGSGPVTETAGIPENAETSETAGIPENAGTSGTTGMPQNGEMPGNAGSGTGTETSVSQYTRTDETSTTFIPVGTDVTTKLGAVTTFSRLAAGDIIEILMENDGEDGDGIVSIWIVG